MRDSFLRVAAVSPRLKVADTVYNREEILKQAKDEIISFLKGTNEQIAKISSYLLAYESVDKETLVKILNENY